MAANINLAAFKRTPFVVDIAIVGPDYTGADFAMHIRNRVGDTGTPLITILINIPGAQGITTVYDPAYVYVKDGVEITAPATIVTIQIDEATLEALALNNPTDQPLALVYDVHVTPVSEIKRVAMFGTLAIYPGVTI